MISLRIEFEGKGKAVVSISEDRVTIDNREYLKEVIERIKEGFTKYGIIPKLKAHYLYPFLPYFSIPVNIDPYDEELSLEANLARRYIKGLLIGGNIVMSVLRRIRMLVGVPEGFHHLVIMRGYLSRSTLKPIVEISSPQGYFLAGLYVIGDKKIKHVECTLDVQELIKNNIRVWNIVYGIDNLPMVIYISATKSMQK